MGQALRTFLLWVFLIAIFIGIYAAESSGVAYGKYLGIAVGVLLLGGILYAARWVSRMSREYRAYVPAQHEAASAMTTGDYVKAAGIYARWSDATNSNVRAAATQGLVHVLIRRGEFEEALTVLGEGDQNWRRIDEALLRALRGDLEDAARMIDSLDLDNPAIAAATALARSIWNLRKGAGVKVANRLQEEWPHLEAHLTAQQLRPLQIVRAFSEASDQRQAGIAGMSLANVRPNFPGEHAYLGKAWPEMAAFLAANDLD